MEQTQFLPLTRYYHNKLRQVNLDFKRSLYNKINWEARIIGIEGPRGVGKTTMLLQRILEKYHDPDATFYISLDHLAFAQVDPLDVIAHFYSRGITEFYIDEVHKYKKWKWSEALKQLYDEYADIRIVYTGSSMLDIEASREDLARRQTVYRLYGMSFREFLEYEKILKIEPVTLEGLLSDHIRIAMEISARTKILKHFDTYLEYGYYPFFRDAGGDFLLRLAATANDVLEKDLPSVSEITYSTIEKAKKLLMIIASHLPFQPNMKDLVPALDTTRDTCVMLLYKMDQAGLLNLLTAELKSYKRLVKPEKIYLGDTNLMFALGVNPEEGTLRETFFANQLSAVSTVQMPTKGDFIVAQKYLFEVGGPYKGFEQIPGVPDSFLAIADIEVGDSQTRIPLWMFGLLY